MTDMSKMDTVQRCERDEVPHLNLADCVHGNGFACVAASGNEVSRWIRAYIKEGAKITVQNSVETDEERFLRQLRVKGHPIGLKASDWNLTTQRSMESNPMHILETIRHDSEESV